MAPQLSDEAIDRFYADLGRRLSSARRAKRWTQEEVAHRAGLTRSSIANVEAGRQRIPLHVLAAISVALRVDAADLFSASQLVEGRADFSHVELLLEGMPESTKLFVMSTLASMRAAPI